MDNNIMYANRMADEPVLMPYQTLPFNGDTFVEEEFLKLKERFNLSTAIEGGLSLIHI